MKLSITSPLSTATPDSAMNPTAAETENGMSRSHKAAMPPVSASGTALNTRSASRAEPKALNKSRKISAKHTGHDNHEALPRRLEILELPAPGQPVSGREGNLLCDLRLRLVNQRADVAPAHFGRHDDPPLAVIPADLIGSFRKVEGRELTQWDGQRSCPGAPCGSVTGKFSSASTSLRTASGSRTMIWNRRSPSNTRPAARPPMAMPMTSCTSERLKPWRAISALVDLDLQERQARDLLDLDVLGALPPLEGWRRSDRPHAASGRNRRRRP